ncbi:MAG: PadR family transcriptional regulator [Planctomycetota bacterium]|nr:PadR family transcriptional regulator [Planctomycetota bacterium]
MPNQELDLPPGALELLVLKVLTRGPMHGYAIVRAIQERGAEPLRIEEGTLYPALHRMERRDLLSSEWGVSESNRRAKFYRLTPTGRAALKEQESAWRRVSEAVGRVLDTPNKKWA